MKETDRVTKYGPLTEWLIRHAGERVMLTFAQIEQIIGSDLPNSSRLHLAHWHGRTIGRPGGAIAEAGWAVEHVDQRGESVTLIRGRAQHQTAQPSRSVGASSARKASQWRTFEDRARRYFSELWAVDLRARDVVVGSGRKRFDLVSADQQVVGDAKSFSEAKGASGKLSGIAEYVFFLQAVPARRRFLVFERRGVALEFLRRWRGVVSGVEFYVLEGERHEVL